MSWRRSLCAAATHALHASGVAGLQEGHKLAGRFGILCRMVHAVFAAHVSLISPQPHALRCTHALVWAVGVFCFMGLRFLTKFLASATGRCQRLLASVRVRLRA